MKLKFWFQRALFTLFGGIGVGLLMVAVTVIQMTGERMSSFWTRMPAFLLLGSGYFLLIMMMMTYKVQLPLAVSFGSTRKESLLGLQLIKCLCAIGAPVFVLGYGLLFPEVGSAYFPLLPFYGAVILLTGTVGSWGGMAYCRWGKLGALITVLVIAFAAMGLGIVSALVFSMENTHAWEILSMSRTQFVVLGISICIGIYLLNILLEARVLRCYEVRM